MKRRDRQTDGKIRILIADDHAVVRDGLSMILELQRDFAVVGQASDGEDAVRQVRALDPDVVIMDLMMPKMDGAAAILKIKAERSPTNILILTSYVDSAKLSEAIQNGASGAIGKDVPREKLLAAIRTVAAGGKVIPREVQRSIDETNGMPALSPRQREVLESLTRGLSNDEIARQYKISRAAIKFHLLELYRKLNVANRAEAVAIALRKHLLKI